MIMKMMLLLMMTHMTIINNPMKLLLMIILSSIIMSFLIFSMTYSYWMSYFIIMIFTGGMLILFMYIISLSPNNKTNINKNILLYLTLTILIPSVLLNVIKEKSFLMNYNLNWFMMLIIILTLSTLFFTAMKLIMSPFKTLKSSF